LFTGLLAVVAIIAMVIWIERGPQDPIYQGKRLSVWLNDMQPGSLGTQHEKAMEAIWTLGTNALGPLPNMLRARDRLPRHMLIALNKFGATRSPVRFHITMAIDQRSRALAAYGLLGPLAGPDVPLLSRMLAEETDPEVRVQAATALHCIHPVGPDASLAVASLTIATHDIDPDVRYACVFALVVIRPRPELLVPVLVERLTDPFAPTRELSRSGLLGIGNAAIPTLRDARQTNQLAGRILQQMHERKLHPEGQARVRYL
jgi:hypothetical protein